MGFFDLNIPYNDNSSSSTPSSKTSRIKVVTKLMELGYSGIAYNRTIKGVMSDHDRCSISRLTLSSLLKLLPSFSSSVDFHRDLLGVPRDSPFRQYTRLTICLNTPSEVLAINSGNLILKTYDLVSVKPLNQHAFDQACEKLEIDIIAIDFAEKLPFRLKTSMVKSAIQRGVYFEITYSRLISDVHERRQVLSTAKLLVESTRGKNLIFSSAASFVDEIRGPYDVANLSTLFGLSMERAKNAISKNCRTLIVKALRRKQFLKDTIKVEKILSNDQFDPKEPWSGDSFEWDPISSGEGDLLLNDLAKSFAAFSKESKIVKAIDFTSVIENMPPQGFKVKDVLSGCEGKLSLNNRDLLHIADVIEPPIAENGENQQSHLSDRDHCSLADLSFENLNSHSDMGKDSRNSEEVKSTVEEAVQPKTSTLEKPIEMDIDDVQSQNLLSSSEVNTVTNEIVCTTSSTEGVLAICNDDRREKSIKMTEDVDSLQNEYVVKSSDSFSISENVPGDKSLTNLVSENQENLPLVRDDTSTTAKCLLGVRFTKPEDVALISENQENMPSARDDTFTTAKCLLTIPRDVALPEDQPSLLKSCPMSDVKGDFLTSIRPQTSKVLMEEQKCGEAYSQIGHSPLDQFTSGLMSRGKCRAKRNRNHSALLLPFKRLINPLAFKKKVRKTKCHR